VYVEVDPGDAILFHGNLLHRSDQNRSDDPRWALICCYNTKSNNPYKESRHPRYRPLDVAEDEAVTAVARREAERLNVAMGSSGVWDICGQDADAAESRSHPA
jgi:hypothetical protein